MTKVDKIFFLFTTMCVNKLFFLHTYMYPPKNTKIGHFSCKIFDVGYAC